MQKETNLEKAKELALILLEVDIQETEIDMFLIHPFLNNRFIPIKDIKKGFIDILESPENLKLAKDMYKELILNANDVWRILLQIHKPYRTLYFKLVNEYLSEEDYNHMLGEVWIMVENPNQDPNVSLSEWISFFKKANKKLLMTDDELIFYNSLPDNDKILIYRGVGKDRNPKGLSWTNNFEKASWFAKRWGNKDAYILKGYCYKKNIYAYFDGRGEKELLTDSRKIFDIERISLI